MRIAIPTRFAHRVGGVETYLESVLPALVARGHDVAVWHEFPVEPNAHVMVPPPVAHQLIGETAAGIDGTCQAIAAWKPDVIFSHGIANVGLERELAGVAPMLVMLHAYHGTCISGTKTHSFPQPRICSRPLGPGCLAQFHVRRCGGLSPVSMLTDYRAQRTRQQLLRACRGVVTLSAHMQRECVAQGVAPERVRVIPAFVPGVAAGGAPPSRPKADNSTRLHVMFAGRLERLKGAGLLLDAVSLLPAAVAEQIRLTVAGSGREFDVCDAAAQRLRARGLQVVLTGWMSPENCAGLMRTADLLVVPSLWPEPYGLVGLEAAALSVPALAFAVGGIPDWLTDDRTGRLLNGPPSAAALARGLEDCVSDRTRLVRWGLAARAEADGRTVVRHLDLLEDALVAAASGPAPSRIRLEQYA